MKRFRVDTNFNWLGSEKPSVYRFLRGELQLSPGERVVVYQDDDEWTGVVRFDPSIPEPHQWYVELDPEGDENNATRGLMP